MHLPTRGARIVIELKKGRIGIQGKNGIIVAAMGT
jgi:hypothetical protein